MKKLSRTIAPLVATLLFSACGGESPSAVLDTITSVRISGDTASLVPGMTSTLHALARIGTATADVDVSTRVTWTSSDTLRARVDAGGNVTTLSAGAATIAATVDGITASTSINVVEGGVVGPTGATLTANAGQTTLIVPAQAVAAVTPLQLKIIPATGATLFGGSAVVIAPRATAAAASVASASAASASVAPMFAVPAQLEMGYDGAALPSDVTSAQLRIGRLDGTTWTPLDATTEISSSHQLVVPISDVGTYGIVIVPVSTGAVGSVSVSFSSTSVFVGGAVQAFATLHDGSGHVISGRSVTWSTSDPAVATVDASGLVRGVAAGPVQVRATSEGKTGSAALTVTAPSNDGVTRVTITLPKTTVKAGEQIQATGTAFNANGDPVAVPITWSSNNPNFASIDATGLITTSGGPAQAQITATAGRATTAALLTIELSSPPPPNSIGASFRYAPSWDTLAVGQTGFLDVSGRDADGYPIDMTRYPKTFGSGSPAVATVDNTGRVTALSAGTSIISVTTAGRTATALLTVVNPGTGSVASLTVSAFSYHGISDDTVQVVATLRNATGQRLLGRPVTWKLPNDAFNATITQAGLVTIHQGSVVVTGTSEGISGTVLVQTTYSHRVCTELEPGGSKAASVTAGKTIRIAVSGHTAAGPCSGITEPVIWTSVNPNVATIVATGETSTYLTGVTAGATTVYAIYRGDTAAFNVTVAPNTVASTIEVTGAQSAFLYDTAAAKAVTRDANGQIVDRPVTWTSSDPTIFRVDRDVGPTTRITAMGLGTATLRAQADNAVKDFTITVVSPPLPATIVLSGGSTLPLTYITTVTATLKAANGMQVYGPAVSWTSSDPNVLSLAAYDNTRVNVTARGHGQATITGTVNGLVAMITITVP